MVRRALYFLCASILPLTLASRVDAFVSYPTWEGHSQLTRSAALGSGFSVAATEHLAYYVRQPDWDETKIDRQLLAAILRGNVTAAVVRAIMVDPIRPNSNYDARHHFDRPPNKTSTDAFWQAVVYLHGQRDEGVTQIIAGQDEAARAALGRALHALQDFYSHSDVCVSVAKAQGNNAAAQDTAKINSILLRDQPGPLPRGLRLTCFDPNAAHAGEPDDAYPHDFFCKDAPAKNDIAKKAINGKSMYQWAYDAARRASTDFLLTVQERVPPAAWMRFKTTTTALLAPASGLPDSFYAWTCTTPSVPFERSIIDCQGTHVDVVQVQTAGNLLLYGVPPSVFSAPEDYHTRDGRIVVVCRELAIDTWPDTSECALSADSWMRIAYQDSDLAAVDPDSLAVHRWDRGTRQWVAAPDTVFDRPHRSVRFRCPSLGIYALTGRPGGTGAARIDPWALYQDTFPATDNEGIIALPATFDTTTALVKTAQNIAPPGTWQRYDVPGDSVVIHTPNPQEDPLQVDLVFRVLPGPGNYVVVGHPEAGRLRKVPTSAAPIVDGDLTNFWSNYLQDNGPFGTPGGHPVIDGKKVWDPNVWNSARCDTLEVNVFPNENAGIVGVMDHDRWQTTYHEADPKGGPAQLGRPRPRCFVTSADGDVGDLVCDGTVPQYILNDPPAAGYNGAPTTVEGTKILPDGLFTPGAHIEYFFRVTNVNDANDWELVPDTTRVYPQYDVPSLDAHRWEDFSVLPDRWKTLGYVHPVTRLPAPDVSCRTLVVDYADRRGDELDWVTVMHDLSRSGKPCNGAHNGWRVADSLQNFNDSKGFVAAHLGQAGDTWDLYQVRGTDYPFVPAGTLGSRYSAPPPYPLYGATSRQGPAWRMLEQYYKNIVVLAGSLRGDILGPFPDRTGDDVGLLRTWVMSGNVNESTRGLWINGRNVVESLEFSSYQPQFDFLTQILGARLRDSDYVPFSWNCDSVPTFRIDPAVAQSGTWNVLSGWSWNGSQCLQPADGGLDVLMPATGMPWTPSVVGLYEESGGNDPPFIASLAKPFVSTHPWQALVDGFSLGDLVTPDPVGRYGRDFYAFTALTRLMPFCPYLWLDAPLAPPPRAAASLTIQNPARSVGIRAWLALPAPQIVAAKLFDVQGRAVATWGGTRQPAGLHELSWPVPSRVRPAVYFLRYWIGATQTSRKVVLVE